MASAGPLKYVPVYTYVYIINSCNYEHVIHFVSRINCRGTTLFQISLSLLSFNHPYYQRHSSMFHA